MLTAESAQTTGTTGVTDPKDIAIPFRTCGIRDALQRFLVAAVTNICLRQLAAGNSYSEFEQLHKARAGLESRLTLLLREHFAPPPLSGHWAIAGCVHRIACATLKGDESLRLKGLYTAAGDLRRILADNAVPTDPVAFQPISEQPDHVQAAILAVDAAVGVRTINGVQADLEGTVTIVNNAEDVVTFVQSNGSEIRVEAGAIGIAAAAVEVGQLNRATLAEAMQVLPEVEASRVQQERRQINDQLVARLMEVENDPAVAEAVRDLSDYTRQRIRGEGIRPQVEVSLVASEDDLPPIPDLGETLVDEEDRRMLAAMERVMHVDPAGDEDSYTVEVMTDRRGRPIPPPLLRPNRNGDVFEFEFPGRGERGVRAEIQFDRITTPRIKPPPPPTPQDVATVVAQQIPRLCNLLMPRSLREELADVRAGRADSERIRGVSADVLWIDDESDISEAQWRRAF